MAKLFNATTKDSSFSLLLLNEEKKDMRLLTLPTVRFRWRYTDTETDFTSLYDNIKNQFVYMSQTGY